MRITFNEGILDRVAKYCDISNLLQHAVLVKCFLHIFYITFSFMVLRVLRVT